MIEAAFAFHMPHNFYALRFPFIEERLPEYFSVEDLDQMKSKVIKILAFDQEVLIQVAARVAKTNLTTAFSGGRRPPEG